MLLVVLAILFPNPAKKSAKNHSSQLKTLRQQKNTDWYCIGAYHVYYGRPNTDPSGDVGTAKLGLKSLKLRCDKTACGPNFCCCFGGIPS